ncbi:MAG: response regulator [Verrucomicrobiota bacterium]
MPTVLLVDDIQGVHDMLDIVFSDAGYQVEHAMLASHAIDIFKDRPIDIVFCDIQMPGTDGISLLKTLRDLDEDVIVIMTTASDSKDYAVQALRYGAFDYVEKPYDEDMLPDVLARGMSERQRRLQLRKGIGGGDRRELQHTQEALMTQRNDLKAAQARTTELESSLEALETELARERNSHKELYKRQQELALREEALKAMDSTLKDRMQALKQLQREKRSSMDPSAEAELNQLKQQLQAKEDALQEMELSIQEREQFIRESEESLLEKGQRLTELEAELEQMREDMVSGGQVSNGTSPEQEAELTELKQTLQAKEIALKHTEEALSQRENAVKRAEALIKARQEFLQQSESILFGEVGRAEEPNA